MSKVPLPFTLPTCDRPATVRLEVYSPAPGDLYGSLDASVYTCEEHGIEAVTAIWTANLTAHKVTMAPDVDRTCGQVHVFPTGSLGRQRPTSGERPAEPGEVCTCGRAAVKVFTGGKHGDTGYCGLPDGGQPGPCAFCGGPRHEFERCPQYRVRPDGGDR